MPLAGEHDLVAFGVGAEGEVGRFAGLVGHRFVAEGAAGSDAIALLMGQLLERMERPRPVS